MENTRDTSIELSKEEFQQIGYRLIDDIAGFLEQIGEKPVTSGESPKKLQNLMGDGRLPENGTSPSDLFARATDLLINHSLFNGHPRFLGYITSSPSPVGILAELLAASVNPNVGAQILSPIATEIEKQTVKWLAEFIGVPDDYGGLLVSGGNMANFTGFLTGRNAMAEGNIKAEGISGLKKLIVYCSATTHIWIEKAASLFGLGSGSVRWIKTDQFNKMDINILEYTVKNDIRNGYLPLMVIGTAGDVSTGVVDNLMEISGICKKYKLWFHVDGAYGIPAAIIPELKPMFAGIEEADSIALDPHKWLYSPLEAGCTLVKNPQHLKDTFSTHPEYYNFDTETDGSFLNYYEYGLQNSRGFRALKVWMMLQHVGKKGYIDSISEDIALAELLFKEASFHPELEAITQNLSIATLRYVPAVAFPDDEQKEAYLNKLNENLLNNLQQGGEVFLSNALVKGKYCLRGCIVNFRTSGKDIKEIIDIIIREGRVVHEQIYMLSVFN